MEASDLTDHISRRFNKDIEDLRSHVLSMGGLVEAQLAKAISAMVSGDSELGLSGRLGRDLGVTRGRGRVTVDDLGVNGLAVDGFGVETALGANAGELRLEHFAISATGIKDLIARIEAEGLRHRLNHIKDFGILQMNLWDPDGNHIHLDFDAAEAEGLEL